MPTLREKSIEKQKIFHTLSTSTANSISHEQRKISKGRVRDRRRKIL